MSNDCFPPRYSVDRPLSGFSYLLGMTDDSAAGPAEAGGAPPGMGGTANTLKRSCPRGGFTMTYLPFLMRPDASVLSGPTAKIVPGMASWSGWPFSVTLPDSEFAVGSGLPHPAAQQTAAAVSHTILL